MEVQHRLSYNSKPVIPQGSVGRFFPQCVVFMKNVPQGQIEIHVHKALYNFKF